MDPMAAEVVSYVGEKLAEELLEQFQHRVFDPRRRKRAKDFIDAFAVAVVDPATPQNEIQSTLTKILDDEIKSEVLFDAYRSACLSLSKAIGPRAIGR